jgi:hypothetical protein
MRSAKLICLLLLFASPSFAQDRGTAEATVKGKKVTITYGRPSLKGRDLLAQAPVGLVWRLGMNQATEISSDGALVVAGKELAAGKYSLWAKKVGDNSWILAFHPKTGIWGAPPQREGFVAELPLKFEKTNDAVEQLTIAVADSKGDALIKINWGNLVLSGAVGVK